MWKGGNGGKILVWMFEIESLFKVVSCKQRVYKKSYYYIFVENLWIVLISIYVQIRVGGRMYQVIIYQRRLCVDYIVGEDGVEKRYQEQYFYEKVLYVNIIVDVKESLIFFMQFVSQRVF